MFHKVSKLTVLITVRVNITPVKLETHAIGSRNIGCYKIRQIKSTSCVAYIFVTYTIPSLIIAFRTIIIERIAYKVSSRSITILGDSGFKAILVSININVCMHPTVIVTCCLERDLLTTCNYESLLACNIKISLITLVVCQFKPLVVYRQRTDIFLYIGFSTCKCRKIIYWHRSRFHIIWRDIRILYQLPCRTSVRTLPG